MNSSDAIRPTHRNRLALVYIRQSSPHQVSANQESLKLQYGLTDRARAYGWDGPNLRVIDADLGRTGRTAHDRPGFQELVTLVTLEQVGILFAYDVTRLARNCTDWYQLLDLCGYRQCLVADQEGIYDPATPNGRLLLGLKGLIAELELHTLRARLNAGLLQKAQRGELALTLPAGLVRDPLGRVVFHPDQEVQDRLRLVFATFLRLKTATKAVGFFQAQNLWLPRRDPGGMIVWRPAKLDAVLTILKNPAYAGAFAYGRRRGRSALATEAEAGQPPDLRPQWKVCLPDHHPGYIDWATFAEIQAMLRDNYSAYERNQSRGVPRPGKALLHGLMSCGACGNKMVVQYKPGTRYLCTHLRMQYQVPVCQNLPADPIDAYVVAAFLEALTPAEVDVYDRAMTHVRAAQAQVDQAHDQHRERLRYQARLAERQYHQVDPDNRLVAAELERRWEAALRELQQAEEESQRRQQQVPLAEALSPELREALERAGRRLPELWQGDLLSRTHKKALLRCLVEKVVAHREPQDTVRLRIIWKGGATTSADLPVAVGAVSRLSCGADLEKQIVRLARDGQTDAAIAAQLTRQGYRSPRAQVVLPNTVCVIRKRQGVFAEQQSHPRQIAGCLTVPQVACQLGVAPHWIYDRIHSGVVEITRDPETRMFLFPDRPKTLAQFRQLRDGKLQKLRF
jgi:DNA invertase Pin-like site-specific DNA recombinase